MLETIKSRWTGVSPLRMHNPQLADQQNQFTRAIKEISSKRKKLDADYAEMAKLEFLGSLYLLKDGCDPIIPANVVWNVLCGKGGAARKQKMGAQAKLGIIVMKPFILEYDGPKEAEELWENKEFVHQQLETIVGSKVMRTTPIFTEWAAEIEIQYNSDFVNYDTVLSWIFTAGNECGILERRPVFGRFEAEVI